MTKMIKDKYGDEVHPGDKILLRFPKNQGEYFYALYTADNTNKAIPHKNNSVALVAISLDQFKTENIIRLGIK